MKIYQESTFTGRLLKSDTQDNEPIEINGNVLFCSNGEVLLRASQNLYDSIQSKMFFESIPIYGAKPNKIGTEEAINNPSLIQRSSIVRLAYEGKYKVQGEIRTDRNLRIKATVSRDTGLKPDVLLQEVCLEDEEALASKENSVMTAYGLIAFDLPCNIEILLNKKGDILKIEKIANENKKSLEANISSKLSIFSRELPIEAQKKLAYFLIFMISFASGRRVFEAYQRIEVRNGRKFKIDEHWRGSRSRALAKGFRVIQQPHLKLFLEQLINEKARLESYRSSLLLSLSWYLETFESNILATNFLLLCTAIEAFNEEFKKIQKSSSTKLISTSKYRAVKKSIFQCVDEHKSDLHGDDTYKYEIFKRKITSFFNSGSLNMTGNLGPSLQDMLIYFKVEYEDLFPKFDFIKIRNNVVHRGTHDFNEMLDVYPRLETLYIRLILCVLEYDGDYMEHNHNGTGLICRTVPFV